MLGAEQASPMLHQLAVVLALVAGVVITHALRRRRDLVDDDPVGAHEDEV